MESIPRRYRQQQSDDGRRGSPDGDAAPKAAGLAAYAEHHGHLFGRIRLIAKVDGDYRQLDLKDPKTRDAVKSVTSSNELKTLYTTTGAPGLA